jgi:hypothetical protein
VEGRVVFSDVVRMRTTSLNTGLNLSLRSSFFWYFTQRRLVVTDVSRATYLISNGDAVSRILGLLDPRRWDRQIAPETSVTKNQSTLSKCQKSEALIYTTAEAWNYANLSLFRFLCPLSLRFSRFQIATLSTWPYNTTGYVSPVKY